MVKLLSCFDFCCGPQKEWKLNECGHFYHTKCYSTNYKLMCGKCQFKTIKDVFCFKCGMYMNQ